MTTGMMTITLTDLLAYATERKASDLHVRPGAPPSVRVNGVLQRAELPSVDADASRAMCHEAMTPAQTVTFEATGEIDFAYTDPSAGRFRMHVYLQKGQVSLAARRVLPSCPPIEVLGLPPAVKLMSEEKRGLILVTGPTSSGKTTTTGAMIDNINMTRACHILTIEDPIEILHGDKTAIVNQREIGSDTADFATGLRAAMREDPDVIFIGEIRDAETVTAALQAAETGHLVISTLHTTDVAETVSRVIDFFPPHDQNRIRGSLAGSLRGIVSQRLVSRKDNRGQVPATEVLVMNGRIRDLIVDERKTHLIHDLIAESSFYGMQTFDQSLLSLFRSGLVSLEDAMATATNQHDFQLALEQEGLQAVS